MARRGNHFRIKITAATAIFPKPRQNTARLPLRLGRILMDMGKLFLLGILFFLDFYGFLCQNFITVNTFLHTLDGRAQRV